MDECDDDDDHHHQTNMFIQISCPITTLLSPTINIHPSVKEMLDRGRINVNGDKFKPFVDNLHIVVDTVVVGVVVGMGYILAVVDIVVDIVVVAAVVDIVESHYC